MKEINWNRVVIAWAIGSLVALAGSHAARAADRAVLVKDNTLITNAAVVSTIGSVTTEGSTQSRDAKRSSNSWKRR